MSESNGDMRVFETGAVRTRDADGERFDLISPIGLRRLAAIYAEGAKKYTAMAWENGMPVSDIMNHGIRHWNLYISGDRSEDHLAKLAWAAFAAMHSEELWPDQNMDLRREGCIAPSVSDETAAERANLRANLAAMKADLVRAARDREDDRVEAVRDNGDGTVGHVPPPVGRRVHFMAHPINVDGLLANRDWLRKLGHEVTSRWVNDPQNNDLATDCIDLQRADVAVVFPSPLYSTRGAVYRARDFSKPVAVIGAWPEGLPMREGEMAFSDWGMFLSYLDRAGCPATADR